MKFNWSIANSNSNIFTKDGSVRSYTVRFFIFFFLEGNYLL